MPRPTTKADLIEAANTNFEKLTTLIESLSDEERLADIFPNERDKNERDVLVHLSEWHRLLVEWINANTKGVAAPFLPEPYNWRNLPAHEYRILEKTPEYAVCGCSGNAAKNTRGGIEPYRNIFQRPTFCQKCVHMDGQHLARQLLRIGNLKPLRLGDKEHQKSSERISKAGVIAAYRKRHT